MVPKNFILTSKRLTHSCQKVTPQTPHATGRALLSQSSLLSPLFQTARFVTVDFLKSYLLLKA
jgi:hypothetical protein